MGSVFWVTLYIEWWLLDHTICSTLSTACFPPCSKLATIFKVGLITDSALHNVSFLLSAQALFEEEGQEAFYEQSFTADEWRKFYSLHKYPYTVAWKIAMICFVNDSVVLNEPLTGCYIWNSKTCIEQTAHGLILHFLGKPWFLNCEAGVSWSISSAHLHMLTAKQSVFCTYFVDIWRVLRY